MYMYNIHVHTFCAAGAKCTCIIYIIHVHRAAGAIKNLGVGRQETRWRSREGAPIPRGAGGVQGLGCHLLYKKIMFYVIKRDFFAPAASSCRTYFVVFLSYTHNLTSIIVHDRLTHRIFSQLFRGYSLAHRKFFLAFQRVQPNAPENFGVFPRKSTCIYMYTDRAEGAKMYMYIHVHVHVLENPKYSHWPLADVVIAQEPQFQRSAGPGPPFWNFQKKYTPGRDLA